MSSPSATISLSLSNSGNVYYRSNPSNNVINQQVVLRTASGSQSQLPQNNSVRMFTVSCYVILKNWQKFNILIFAIR